MAATVNGVLYSGLDASPVDDLLDCLVGRQKVATAAGTDPSHFRPPGPCRLSGRETKHVTYCTCTPRLCTTKPTLLHASPRHGSRTLIANQ